MRTHLPCLRGVVMTQPISERAGPTCPHCGHDVRHLCMFSRSEIRKWPNFGRKCLNEVEEMLRARGLQLWENHDERSLREHKEYFK